MYIFVHLEFYSLQRVLALRPDHRLSLSTPLLSSEASDEAEDKWAQSSVSSWQLTLGYAL